MKIVWTRKSETQLDQIFQYIASDSSLYAYRTVQRIIEEAESVSRHPRKGRTVPEYEQNDIREVFHHPYRIVYLIKEETGVIEILAVIHGSRQLPEEPE